MSNMWCRHHNVWPIFANQYCSLQQQFSDGVGSLLDASNLLSCERNQKLLWPNVWQELPGGTQYFSWAPSCPRDVALLVCGWFLFLFICGFSLNRRAYSLFSFWFEDFTKSGGLVHCDIFQSILLNSQSLLGKVSWGNQNLLLSLQNSEIKTTLQNNWVRNVACRPVTQSIGQ